MSLHAILEKLIHSTTFRTEAEQHQMLDLLDAYVERPEPISETSLARTDWKTPIPRAADGTPIPQAASATDVAALVDQNRRLIAMLQKGMAATPQAPPEAPTLEAPTPVSPSDVPPGVT